jgi:hypothetical protein
MIMEVSGMEAELVRRARKEEAMRWMRCANALFQEEGATVSMV